MKKFLLAASVLTLCASAQANAAIVLSATPGAATYTGPAPTFDFEAPTPEFTGGSIVTGTVAAQYTQPLGSTGFYAAVGPSATLTPTGPAILNLSSFGSIAFISFILGSVDNLNKLEVLDSASAVLATFTGTQVKALLTPDGMPFKTSPTNNPIVRLDFDAGSETQINSLRLSATSNAFETDNFVVGLSVVPEPSTWMMLLIGFAAVGFSMRRRTSVTARVHFT